MNSLFIEFSNKMEGYFWRCLRLFRDGFGEVVGGHVELLSGYCFTVAFQKQEGMPDFGGFGGIYRGYVEELRRKF